MHKKLKLYAFSDFRAFAAIRNGKSLKLILTKSIENQFNQLPHSSMKNLTTWYFLFNLLTVTVFTNTLAQTGSYPVFREIILRVDTTDYRLSDLHAHHREVNLFPFTYRHENELAEIRFIPLPSIDLELVAVKASPDISVLWFEKAYPEEFFRVYLRFDQITRGNFFAVTATVRVSNGDTIHQNIVLQPVAQMQISLMGYSEEIFTGEEVVNELNVNLPENLIIRPDWVIKDSYHYRISQKNGSVFLHLMAFQTGRQKFSVDLDVMKPTIDSSGRFSYKHSFTTQYFNVQASRMAFLGIDAKEVILDDDTRLRGVEVHLDDHRLLQLDKTYRIEAQEEIGGILIAELLTKSDLVNHRVLAVLRPYNFHHSRDGYLYIKDGDQAKFLTNFSVIPQSVIHSVKLMREGREWSEQLRVNPNETVIVRITGQSLDKSHIAFDVPGGRVTDTISWSESEAEFSMHIPMEIPKSRINLQVNNRPSGYALTVAEYQLPRQFDFIHINYGDKPTVVSGITGPVFYESSIRDIVIGFDRFKIDEDGRLFGKQYLDIEVRILGPRGELLETFRQNGVAVCPAENSLRFQYYTKNDCRLHEISLNQHLTRKTHSWEIWTRAIISIEHSSDKYTSGHHRKTVEIILQRPLRFDVDVSFPAGLLIISPENEKIGNLSGISMAMIAQFSFYHREKIAVMKPYKIGVGFLALNAFNFSESSGVNRDMGIVLIGSIFPTRKDTRMSFPLYIGAGYFLNQKDWFMLLGPGIRVSF